MVAPVGVLAAKRAVGVQLAAKRWGALGASVVGGGWLRFLRLLPGSSCGRIPLARQIRSSSRSPAIVSCWLCSMHCCRSRNVHGGAFPFRLRGGVRGSVLRGRPRVHLSRLVVAGVRVCARRVPPWWCLAGAVWRACAGVWLAGAICARLKQQQPREGGGSKPRASNVIREPNYKKPLSW